MVNRDEYRQMVLAGTVSFPATFPQVGRISLTLEKIPASHQPELEFLSVTESPSARVTMVRRVMAKSVRAVFIPRDPRQVNYADGEWLLGDEVLPGLTCKLGDSSMLHGIVFVPENEPSMLNVSVGMTAAESVQYYPPLPNDPAHNHYNAWPASSTGRSLAPHSEPIGTDAVGSGACLPLIEDELGACNPMEECTRGHWACASADEAFQSSIRAIDETAHVARSLQNVLWACNAYPAE